jgi:hypothetical protein
MPPTINPYLWPLSEQDLQRPDIVEQIINSFQRPYDPAAQGYDPRYIQDLSTRPVVDWTEPDAPVPQEIQDLQPTRTFEPSNGVINRTPPIQNAQVTPTIQPVQQPSTGQSKSASAMPEGYEEYLKIFQNTLGAAPELDKKRRNQLAMVAGINALGQALKQVVDFHGRSKYGAPITPQQDQLTPALLSQYEKEYQDYQQRKDRYNLQKTNTMQQALQYAYGDEKAREQYEKQLDLLGKQQKFSSEQTDKEIAAREKLAKDQADLVGKRDDKQYQQDLEKMQKNFEYESALAAQRASEAMKAVKERYGFQAATKTATELAKKSLLVTDEDPNKPIVIPPQLYLDILQKQIALQNQDFTEFLTSTDFNATNNAGDIMVARYWKDFYTPVYDVDGNVISWESKGAKYETTPQATPGGDEMPSIFIPKQ